MVLMPETAPVMKTMSYFVQIETYVKDHSEAQFSHSICPSCLKELYPDYYRDMIEKQQ